MLLGRNAPTRLRTYFQNDDNVSAYVLLDSARVVNQTNIKVSRVSTPTIVLLQTIILKPRASHHPAYSRMHNLDGIPETCQKNHDYIDNACFRPVCSPVASLRLQRLVQYWYVLCDLADDQSAVCSHPQHAQQECRV